MSSDVKITIASEVKAGNGRAEVFFRNESPEEVSLHLVGYLDAKSLCQVLHVPLPIFAHLTISSIAPLPPSGLIS
jgi:hypothetical protein